ncbi:MAG: hypothetical protein GY850_08030 [bacterium]|nr:hypothetical protein [bacterium]
MNAPEYIEPIEKNLDTPDGNIHYLDWGGDGIQVHMLHANGFCAGTYSPFIKHLTDGLHIFASDLRGHGDSAQPNLKRVDNWHIFA